MHICISKLTIIGSYNVLSPGQRQAITWTNAGILLIGPLETNFSELFIKIYIFSFKKMHLKIDGLVQERRNYIANAWSYVFLALTHQNVIRKVAAVLSRPQSIKSLALAGFQQGITWCAKCVQKMHKWVKWPYPPQNSSGRSFLSLHSCLCHCYLSKRCNTTPVFKCL